MNAPAENTAQLSYFEQLGDKLHHISALFKRQKKAEGDAMSEFAYELAQLGFSFVFANSVSDDFEEDIENINYYMTKYKPAFEQNSDYKFPEIDLDFILSVRKFTNIFEIRKAAQTATIPQLETAQFIWKTICLVIGQLVPEEQRSEIGLTPARRFQGAFGPLVQSLIVVALQTEGQAALVRIFELLAAGADQLEAARECGVWTGHEGAQQFWTESPAPISWSRWKVFGWNFGKGSIALCLSKNEELDHEKLGVFGSENSSAITSSGLPSPLGKNLRNWAAHEINYKTEADGHRACDGPRLEEALADLMAETSYDKVEIDSKRAVSISLVRAACVRLARVLQDSGSGGVFAKAWLNIASTDPLPEVRFALS